MSRPRIATEQTYDTTLNHGLIDATVPAPDVRRWPLRPADALEHEHELERPARRPGPEREGPSLGF